MNKTIKKYKVWSKSNKCFVEQHAITFEYDDYGCLNIKFPNDDYVLYDVTGMSSNERDMLEDAIYKEDCIQTTNKSDMLLVEW